MLKCSKGHLDSIRKNVFQRATKPNGESCWLVDCHLMSRRRSESSSNTAIDNEQNNGYQEDYDSGVSEQDEEENDEEENVVKRKRQRRRSRRFQIITDKLVLATGTSEPRTLNVSAFMLNLGVVLVMILNKVHAEGYIIVSRRCGQRTPLILT